MTLPPRWKIKRELYRIRDKVGRWISGALIDPPRQFLYDRMAGSLLEITEGEHALTPRVAVFVLFQPKGLAASTLFTLDHLIANDWSPVVISNAPLSERDRAEVARRAAKVIERPNVGYDFGAYREGIRFLDRIGHSPDRLILMNDSTWFPLREGDDTLARMEASGADMVGHIYKVEASEKRGRDHVESHLWMFNSRTLSNPVFAEFWRRYLMANSRESTVARGEKGLSQALMKAGLSVAGLLSRETLISMLQKEDDDRLLQTIGELVHHDAKAQAFCRAIANGGFAGASWRPEFIQWVSDVLSNSRQHLISATFISPAMRLGGMGFVKKAEDRRFHLARQKVLQMEKDGQIPPLDTRVRLEIEARVSNWVAPFDWRQKAEEPMKDTL